MRPSSWYRKRTRGVDVRLGLPVGGDHQGELAGRVPVQRTLALQHAGQVAEERMPRNGSSPGPGSAHEGMVGRWMCEPVRRR